MRESTTELLVNLPADTNVTDLLLEQHRRAPDGALYSVKKGGQWQDISASEFLDQVQALAKGLISRGVRPGDTVAVMSKTRYEWTLADVAIWFAGAVTVPIYETSSASQVAWILQDSAAGIIFVEDDAKAAVVRSALGGTDSDNRLYLMNNDDGGDTFAALVSEGSAIGDDELEAARASRNLDDVASLVYTSGTTGAPKGCEITHGNFALFAVNTLEFLPELLREKDARTLMFLPLAHVLARAVQVVCLAGGVKLGHTANAADLLEDLSAYRPTFLLVVPRIFEKIYATAEQKAKDAGKGRLFEISAATAVSYSRALDTAARGGRGPSVVLKAQHALFNRLLYPKLRGVFGGEVTYTVSGASPLSEHLAHFFRGAGIQVQEGYGLTESTAPCTANTVALTRVGSVGIPMPGTTVRMDTDGEIQIKGVGVFKGYHNNQQANADAFTEDGFFRTGDVGQLDEDGFLTITGRKKDLLVTAGGKNVAPGPLEETLREHRLIAHAVVVGDGRPFIGAFLTLDPEAVATWGTEAGLGGLTVTEAASHAGVRAELQSAVDEANSHVSAAEQIRKFTVRDQDFGPDSGYLTPTLKLKRAAVVADLKSELENLYSTP
ncbi:long-chain acyl-CoA synthetase [Arthrobacter sp. CAN_A212]|uniref:AMP-dependent synthetase/ligase n=1 Tax=unclassified Arthrobacter TaxID=235627 RepID=UPI0018CA337B|nr:AMP-dependent synthetase/ligase [Arthrobacter sp. CAN_C5]MBP2217768.1 long-chain acyl-CoA synthetase [Arthrobacter sp. CAN_C5]